MSVAERKLVRLNWESSKPEISGAIRRLGIETARSDTRFRNGFGDGTEGYSLLTQLGFFGRQTSNFPHTIDLNYFERDTILSYALVLPLPDFLRQIRQKAVDYLVTERSFHNDPKLGEKGVKALEYLESSRFVTGRKMGIILDQKPSSPSTISVVNMAIILEANYPRKF